MKTLIELYDERPIENVLATEVFRPERTVFLCPPEVAQNKRAKSALTRYFKHCGLSNEAVFLESSLYYADKVAAQLRTVCEDYPDPVVDITGGTDAALFACGIVCAEQSVPAFTYSRKRNCFFAIHGRPFEGDLPCAVRHTVEDCFLMAGGELRTGRVDNSVLSRYEDSFGGFFDLYLKYRADWTKAVSYIQHASQKGGNFVRAGRSIKGDRGVTLQAPEALLRDLAALGFLSELKLTKNEVGFRFKDAQVRAWLRDIGSVLELYVWKECKDTGLFCDVRTSAVVDWEGQSAKDAVTNEIDVMCMQGILPVFISCKTCAVTTEALNELAILRDRFGGKGAKAAIVTTQSCRNITRNRAAELDIDVIDLSDLRGGKLQSRVTALLQAE